MEQDVISVGGVLFPANGWADDGITALTTPGPRGEAQSPASAADGTTATGANINDSFVEIRFTDNVLVNGPGPDLVMFLTGNNDAILLTADAETTALSASATGRAISIPRNSENNFSGFDIGAWFYDLSDLNFEEGQEFTGGLYLRSGGIFTTVWDVAALNSLDEPSVPEEPEFARVGDITFDLDAWADGAVVASTAPGTLGPATTPGSGADGDTATATNLNNSFVELLFTDNVLVNGPGADLVLFTNTNNNVVRLSAEASPSAATITSSAPTISVPPNVPGNDSGFGIGAVLYDLSDLGFAEGAELTEGVFLSRGAIFSTVWDAAALNSQAARTLPQIGPDVAILEGDDGRDRLQGSAEDELLVGRGGRDILIGAGGADVMAGGGGVDYFVLRDDPGAVTITDWRDGGDGRDLLALDDQLFGLGDDRIDVREVTFDIVRSVLDAGQVRYSKRTGELRVDTDGRDGPGEFRTIAVIEGGGALSADDILLF